MPPKTFNWTVNGTIYSSLAAVVIEAIINIHYFIPLPKFQIPLTLIQDFSRSGLLFLLSTKRISLLRDLSHGYFSCDRLWLSQLSILHVYAWRHQGTCQEVLYIQTCSSLSHYVDGHQFLMPIKGNHPSKQSNYFLCPYQQNNLAAVMVSFQWNSYSDPDVSAPLLCIRIFNCTVTKVASTRRTNLQISHWE